MTKTLKAACRLQRVGPLGASALSMLLTGCSGAAIPGEATSSNESSPGTAANSANRPASDGADPAPGNARNTATPSTSNTPTISPASPSAAAAGAQAATKPSQAAAGQAGTDAPPVAPTADAKPQNSLERPDDPVVLSGAALSSLAGKAPDTIVAFRFAAGAWAQIPVQVDERAEVDYYDVYNKQYTSAGSFRNLSYVDPSTLTGPDSDPTIDADDELVLMARDFGDKPEVLREPPGVLAGSAVEVGASAPGVAQKQGYAYLFVSGGTLEPSAGKSYVRYTFKLVSGSYPADYKFTGGPNPEDSVVETSSYQRHFADRWLSDVLAITAGGAPGTDILDVEETRLLDGCSRHIGTFDMGEGAFVTNKSGPIRAIRSYVGANSGPLTQKTHWFYEAREDQLSQLRVHALPWGPMSTIDFSAEAIGLTYYDNNNRNGALIDGTPDKLTPATNDSKLAWQLITGPQATLVALFEYDTDVDDLMWSSVFVDEKNTTATQCNGDTKQAYGECGPNASGALPTTDPTLGGTNHMNLVRHHYFLPPNAQVSDAERLAANQAQPLELTVTKL